MKIIVIGASGTIGRAVSEELSQRHDVIRVGRTRGDYQVDITSQESVEALFAQTGEVDAIVSTTGNLHFGPLSTMTDSQFNLGLQDKLLGQIRLALIGQHFLRDGGSITLVSGIVAQEPIAQGVNATTVNAGLEGFVRAAACELPRGIRINLISPTVLSESLAAYGAFSRALPASPPPPWRRPIVAALKAFRPAASTRSATSLRRPAGAGAYIRPSLQVH